MSFVILLHICYWSPDDLLGIVNVMRGCHFKAFRSYIFNSQLCWYSCWCGLAADLIVAISRETLWTCIGSRGKVILLCFLSELLGLEGAPAWVRSRWSSVGLLSARWMIWYILLEKKLFKRRNAFTTDGDSAQDGSDFNWDDYLEETGALSVPHHAFKHVGGGSQLTAAIYNKWLCDIHVKAVLSLK